MRVASISTNKLFGIFNHRIALNMSDRITIIHGPNGFGKTAILRMLSGLFNSRYSDLRTFPFATFAVGFDNGKSLTVTKETNAHEKKKKDNGDGQEYCDLVFAFSGHSPFRQLGKKIASDVHFPLDMIEHAIPHLDRTGPRTWINMASGEQLSLEDVLARYPDELPTRLPRGLDEPEWFRELKDSIDIHFIQTQRLTGTITPAFSTSSRARRHSSGPAVSQYSTELAAEIKSTLAKYAELSQSLDRTFPHRLVSEGWSAGPAKDLSKRLAQLEFRRSQLMAAGLLDQEGDMPFTPTGNLDQGQSSVLSLYVDDVEKKLGVFDGLYSKIEIFRQIIERRFLHKNMKISKEGGFEFATPDGLALAPTSLSTGEQHEIVMLYEMLFKVKPNSLILIDEPEISLHIAWQEQFLKDLHHITALSKFDVLVATHSPQIISDRWDLTVELRSPEA